jgi:hypothetical protein
MKNKWMLLLLLFFGKNGFSQIIDDTIDDPGDIAIIAYHNDPDGFSFVFLDNCPNNTLIRFIDEEWDGNTLAFASPSLEGEVLWKNNTGTTILRGTVVSIENADNHATINASIGIATEDNSGFNLGIRDDGLIAISGTRTHPNSFLTFFGDSTDSSLTGTTLTNGITANQDSSYGTGYYDGPTNCLSISIEECAIQLNSKENWNIQSSFPYPSSVMSHFGFEVLSKQEKTQIGFKIYPTLVADYLHIENYYTHYNLKIYNSLGVLVAFQQTTTKTTSTDLSNLTSGIYIARIEQGNQSITKKIFKR